MDRETAARNHKILARLKRRWAFFAAICLSTLAAGFMILVIYSPLTGALRWLTLASLLILYLLIVFWRNLAANHPPGIPGLRPRSVLRLSGDVEGPSPQQAHVPYPCVLTIGAGERYLLTRMEDARCKNLLPV